MARVLKVFWSATGHQNGYNRIADYAVSDQDVPQRFVYSFTHALPFGRGRRTELRRIISDHGLYFVGLHNILTVPSGMQATSNDRALRQRTWEFVRRLVDLCSDLGPHAILVFGLGKQRD